MTFELDQQIEQSTHHVIDMDLCKVLLVDDKRFPWLLLVPMQPDIVELFDLDEEDQILLALEVNYSAKVLKDYTNAKKMNVGTLGNMVPQLHMHVIARNEGDVAWPGPAFGVDGAESYDPTELKTILQELRAALDYD